MVSTPVDLNGDVGRSCSVALRPNGDPVVAYYDATLGALKLAERIQNVWHTQFITPVEGTFYWCALALDQAGTPHVVYAPQIGLMHLARLGGFWVPDTISVSGSSWDGSLAVDAAGQLHVSFYLYQSGLYYAHRDPLGWQVEHITAGPTGPVVNGEFSSIVVRPDGTPVICCARWPGLFVFTRNGPDWTLDDGLYDAPSIASPASMALGKDGMLRIAFCSSGATYAYQDSAGWHHEQLPSGFAATRCVSLRLNSLDSPLIASLSGGRSSVLLAYGGPDQWQFQAVDSSAFNGLDNAWCSLALDRQGFPRVAYYAGSNSGGDLRFVEGPAGVSVALPAISARSVALGPPRPNPARASAAIFVECLLPARQDVRIAFYDLLGRELARGQISRLGPGRSTLSLNLPSISPGVIIAALCRSDGRLLASRRIAILR
jgi:hypothetical protein